MTSGSGRDQGWHDQSWPQARPESSDERWDLASSQPTPQTFRPSSADYPAPDQPVEQPSERPAFQSPDYGSGGYSGRPSYESGIGADQRAQLPPLHTADQPRHAVGQPDYGPPQSPPAKRRVGVGLVALVTLIALVIGGASGFLGSRLGAEQGAATGTVPSSAPSTEPTFNGSTAPDPVPPTKGEADTVGIAEAVLPSTVTIRVSSGGSAGLGSGFVIDDEGRVMTNNHVVAAAADGGTIRVTFADGTSSDATLLGRSPSYDLAVIEVEDPDELRPVRLGDSDQAKVGSAAVAIGSPLGLGGTVTEGIISAVDRPVAVGSESSPDGAAYLNALQTDAPINRGNSGGPLVNGNGEVIGVNSAILTGSSSADEAGNIGIGFAIPMNQAHEIGELLIRDGHATYPVINASVTTDESQQGVVLSGVEAGGAADSAGLREGDVVQSIDGERVAEAEDLIVAIRNHRPGDTVTLEFERNGATREASVELASKRG